MIHSVKMLLQILTTYHKIVLLIVTLCNKNNRKKIRKGKPKWYCGLKWNDLEKDNIMNFKIF